MSFFSKARNRLSPAQGRRGFSAVPSARCPNTLELPFVGEGAAQNIDIERRLQELEGLCDAIGALPLEVQAELLQLCFRRSVELVRVLCNTRTKSHG